MDAFIIKPMLIYKYEKDSHKRQKEFYELLNAKGNLIQDAFVKETSYATLDRKS